MERVISVEEKIRRAEEIYQRRKQGDVRPVAKVTVNHKKDIKLLRKMIIQILICVSIYLVIYTVQNNQYVFSEDFINKANELLSYDTNFVHLYEILKSKFINNIEKETEEVQEEVVIQQESIQEIVDETAIGGAEQEIQEEINILTQEEIDIQNIRNTTSFIKPVEGVVSSRYGQRETATGNVPKNHTGTDIAANLGNKIKSATDGEVVLASEEGDYRKTFKNSNR